jgi:putative oxidoreductase
MSDRRAYRIWLIIARWVPAILLILIFAPQGWAKFSATSGWAVAFRHWGYPVWFRITIGCLELAACVLLVSGRAAALGALVIVSVMLGAMTTHVLFDHGQHVTSEVVPLTLALITLLMRRDQLSSLRRMFRARAWSALLVERSNSIR